jgi:hypothetical protein
MQRERSALRLLYELLVLHYPNLPLGEFLPVGSAFAAIFPESGVEASKKVEVMQDVHHQYYSRLAPAMQKIAEERATEFNAERQRALDQLVKTVLLAEVSPRLKQGGLTIERLVQLNSVDVEGETFRSRVRVAETDLLALSQLVPDLQVAGQGKTAIVRYVLGRVSLGAVLVRARSKVEGSIAKQFEIFWKALKLALELENSRGFEEGGVNEGEWDLTWRGTKRRGRIKLGNIRELSYDDFVPPDGAFRVLIDYRGPSAATKAGLCPAPCEDLRPSTRVGESARCALSRMGSKNCGLHPSVRAGEIEAWTSSWSGMLARSPGRCRASTACCFAVTCRL